MAAVRSAVLKHLRVRASLPPLQVSAISISRVFGRFFSEEVKGSFLDKSEVTDRVITVVKNFQKVEPSKELRRQQQQILQYYWLHCRPPVRVLRRSLGAPPSPGEDSPSEPHTEHIGTKTAVQIRSHAQKFFSKVLVVWYPLGSLLV